MTYWKRATVVSITLLTIATIAGAADYEKQANKPVSQALPPALAAGPDFKVSDPVVADGYMYKFTGTSTHGPFDVPGTGALRKLEHEIAVISQLKNITRSEVF